MRSHRHNQQDVEHTLLALLDLEKGVPSRILAESGVPSDNIRTSLQQTLQLAPKSAYEANQIYLTPRAQRLLENAGAEAARLNDEFVSAEYLSIAAVMEPEGRTAGLLRANRVGREHVYQALNQVRGGHRVDDTDAESRYGSPGALQRRSHSNGGRGHARPRRWPGPRGQADPVPPTQEQPGHRR